MDKNYLYLRCNYDDDDNDVGDYNDKDRDDLPIEKQMLKYSFFYDQVRHLVHKRYTKLVQL